jgi:hypothetical protein
MDTPQNTEPGKEPAGNVWIQVAADNESAIVSQSAGEAVEGLIKVSGDRLRSAFDAILTAEAQLIGAIKKMAQAPKSIEMEFGISIGAEIGFITKGTAEGNFKIIIKWEK